MQIDIMEHIKYVHLIVIVSLFNLCFTVHLVRVSNFHCKRYISKLM